MVITLLQSTVKLLPIIMHSRRIVEKEVNPELGRKLATQWKQHLFQIAKAIFF